MDTAELYPMEPKSQPRGRILLVDDQPAIRRGYARALQEAGFTVECAAEGNEAAAFARASDYDAILSDISMPGLDGLELLEAVHAHNPDIPVILMTGYPALESAVLAIERRAARYLIKPVALPVVVEAIEHAVHLRGLARLQREAFSARSGVTSEHGTGTDLDGSFRQALDTLWLAYQPIVSWSTRTLFGYEALLRTNEAGFPNPGSLIDAAHWLGRLPELGRAIRNQAAQVAAASPAGCSLFVNLHPVDLLDADLFAPSAPLSKLSERVILEITERAATDQIVDVERRIANLKSMGFRIAVDDLGSGYSSLASLALLDPHIVKLDMSLIRDVHRHPVKQSLLRSITGMCKDMRLVVVAEGIETVEEREVAVAMGCDLLQGYLLGKPAKGLITPRL